MKNLTAGHIDEMIEFYNNWGMRGFTDSAVKEFAIALKEDHPKLAAKFDAEFERRQTPRVLTSMTSHRKGAR